MKDIIDVVVTSFFVVSRGALLPKFFIVIR